MTRKLTDNLEREERLNKVLLTYVEAVQEGHAPDREDVLALHPDLRGELEEFFASHDEIERLAAPLRVAAAERSLGPESGPIPAASLPSAAAGELGQLGDFRLLREIGRGGMGVVYEAEQISLRRRVALKVLPFAAAIDPRQLQRFQNEALAAAHLRHEHVVPVYAVGCERGVHYYAMQFVEGQSLAALIVELRRRAGVSHAPPGATETTGPYVCEATPDAAAAEAASPLAASISQERSSGSRRHFDWVAGIGRQAALALEHAHQMGIIHRDIKPANLLLDPGGQLWVADFGLAQFSSNAGLTATGEVLGTLRYASPEQALGRPGLVDHRSDIYSLGATLYELLTLWPIFDGRDRHELLRQIANDEPVPLRSLDRSIPVELETIILKAVAKEPGDRYATAQEFADDLQCFVDDRPIRARRPTLLEQSTKWARRHRPVVASAVVALLLSVAGLSVATVLTSAAYDRERQKAQEADESFRQAQRAVDQFARIGAEEMANDPALEVARWRLLETALAYYQDFIDQRRDDPSIQAELEASRARVRTILAELTTLMGMAHYHHLLEDRTFQEELKLTEDQRAALGELDLTPFGRRGPGGRGPGGPRGTDERERLDRARDQEANVEKILEPWQFKRFKQITLQLRGPLAFSDLDMAEALKLTAEQKKAVREMQDKVVLGGRRFGGPRGGPPGKRGGRGGPPDGPPGKRGEHPEQSREWQDARDRILDLLTPEQLRLWKEMTGKPFSRDQRPGSPPR
jgi:hypothetical protein